MTEFPDQSRPANPADAANPPAEEPKGVVFQCQRCGQDLPPMDGDLARLARSAGGVTLAHDVCPGEAPPKPVGRLFEVRVQVYEVTEVTDTETGEAFDPEYTELIAFTADHRAVDLDTAMRPLALALGEKWQKAEKHAKITDAAATL